MIGLPQLKARITRLAELTQGLVREVHAWRGVESPLLAHERREYLGGIQTALAAAEEARVTLAAVVKRLEKGAGLTRREPDALFPPHVPPP